MTIDLDFVTLPSPNLGGSAASISAAGPGQMQVDGLTGMTPSVVFSDFLLLAGSTSDGNNNCFPIVGYVSPNSVICANLDAVIPDAGPLTWALIDGTDNNWVVTPSSDDSTDPSNMDFAFNGAKQILDAAGVVPVVELAEAAFPFFVGDQVNIPDFGGSSAIRALITSQGVGRATVQVGTSAGGPMRFLATQALMTMFNPAGIPSGWVFYELHGGTGSNYRIANIDFQAPESSNQMLGFNFAFPAGTLGPAPWENFVAEYFIRRLGVLGQMNTGFVSSISAPAAETNLQTLECFQGVFTPDMAGENLCNYASPDPTNNGVFAIVDVLDSRHVTFVNAAGVANAFPNNRWAILPPTIYVGRNDCVIDNCTATAEFGDPLEIYSGTPIPNVKGFVDHLEFGIDAGLGDPISPPVTIGNPYGGDTGYEFQYCVLPNGDTYYTALAHRHKTGNFTMSNCISTRTANLSFGPSFNWGDVRNPNQDLSWLQFEQTPQTPSILFENNLMVDCGLSPSHGSGNVMTVTEFHGTVRITNHQLLCSPGFGSNDPNNTLTWLSYNGWPNWVLNPAQTDFFAFPLGNPDPGVMIYDMNKPLPTLIVDDNDIAWYHLSGDLQGPSLHVDLFSIATTDNFPTEQFAACVFRNNAFSGDAFDTFDIEGTQNVDIENNGCGCIAGSQQIFIGSSSWYIRLKNNRYTPNYGFEMQADNNFNVSFDPSTRYCEAIDTIGQQPALGDSASIPGSGSGLNTNQGYVSFFS